MKDNNCIFCKLANGEIPTATIYEDEDFRVILDANPAAKGHCTHPSERTLCQSFMSWMMSLRENQ